MKTAELFSVANLRGKRIGEAGEAVRAAKLLAEVRSCFTDPHAIDMRSYYEKLFERWEKQPIESK